jgi:hypothetical protein
LEAGTVEFPFEKEAIEIEGKLAAMLHSRELPLASDFTGASLMPRRYRTIAPGVSEAEFGADGAFQDGLAQWIQSLGNIRRAGFFALSENVVRYEIASDPRIASASGNKSGQAASCARSTRSARPWLMRALLWLLLLAQAGTLDTMLPVHLTPHPSSRAPARPRTAWNWPAPKPK